MTEEEKIIADEVTTGEESKIAQGTNHQTLWTHGLCNLGNTCYMNAIIQSLYACNQFKEMLWKKDSWPLRDNLLIAIDQTFREQLKGTFAPEQLFKEICSIKGGEKYSNKTQEDACELLRDIIQHWSTRSMEWKNLFKGGVISSITCSECNLSSSKYEKFTDLSLPIGDTEIPKNRSIRVEELLESFTAETVLDEDNKYRCGMCKTCTTATKQIIISNAPQILVLQIKRFSKGSGCQKLRRHVEFDDRITISVEGPDKKPTKVDYNLRAVVVHTGKSIEGGHFVAMTRLNNGGIWIRYNDVMRRKINWPVVKSSEAYLLLWEKCTAREGANITSEKCTKNRTWAKDTWNSTSMNSLRDDSTIMGKPEGQNLKKRKKEDDDADDSNQNHPLRLKKCKAIDEPKTKRQKNADNEADKINQQTKEGKGKVQNLTMEIDEPNLDCKKSFLSLKDHNQDMLAGEKTLQEGNSGKNVTV